MENMDSAWARHLISTLAGESMEVVQQRALTNYHVPGLTSIVLHRSLGLTLRLYVTLPGESHLAHTSDPLDNSLWIHDHRFDFQCQTLVGYMKNLRFRPGNAVKYNWGVWHRYEYKSALINPDKRMRVTSQGMEPLECWSQEWIGAGESYSMEHDELHRIMVPDDRLTVMLFWEYKRITKPSTLWSLEPLPEHPSVDGLYVQPTMVELEHLLSIVLSAI